MKDKKRKKRKAEVARLRVEAKEARKKLQEYGNDSTKQERDTWKKVMIRLYRAKPPKTEKKVLTQLIQMGFSHQHLVCGYIADFAHLGKKVIVELDGPVHEGREEYDAHRDQVLKDDGWKVLRFRNQVVKGNKCFVLNRIRESIGLGEMPTQPLKEKKKPDTLSMGMTKVRHFKSALCHPVNPKPFVIIPNRGLA